MPLPTKEEIRELARALFVQDLPSEIRYKAPSPEDYELIEGGYWQRAQRELMTGERRRMEDELARWEELTEPEKVELRERIQSFDSTLSSLEEDWKEYLKRKEEALKPKLEVRPRRFSPGDTVARGEQEGSVRDFRWNDEKKGWEYLVEWGQESEWVSEEELAYVWKAPPEARVPAVPKLERAPRVPRAPPTLDEITRCPFTGHALMRYTGTIKVMVEKAQEVELPITERFRRRDMGLPETETKVVWAPQEAPIPQDLIIYHDDKRDCPGLCRYYELRDMTLSRSMTYDELVERVRRYIQRISRPLIPEPGVSPTRGDRILTEAHAYERGIDFDPAFRKYVEEEVGLPWEDYQKQDPWVKQAARQEFIKQQTKVGTR